MRTLAIETPTVVVLTPDESKEPTAGALFETFVGNLLQALGFEQASPSHINVSSNGIELDLVTRHRVSRSKLIVECKCHTSNVSAHQVDAFYGKLNVQRFDEPTTTGYFVALPKLTAAGEEQARTIEASDAQFKYLNATDVAQILAQEGTIVEPPEGLGIISDPTIIITHYGIYQAARQLNEETRRATSTVLWSKETVPQPVLNVVETSWLSEDLPVRRAQDSENHGAESASQASTDEIIVSVVGSRSDFEYHLPAAPRFFIGRQQTRASLEEILLRQEPSVLVLNAQSGWGKSSLALRCAHDVERAGGQALVVDARTASSPAFISAALQSIASGGEKAGLLQLDTDAAFGSISSSLRTLNQAIWASDQQPLLLFFDQFENVFKDITLTRAFRDLALGVREINTPLKIGFAWKTDLVGWTEGHPYQERDEIREASHVFTLGPMGATEVSTLLKRLQRQVRSKLSQDVRNRLREYSGGLPWLFKKLAGHIIEELQRGATQDQLLADMLNVQGLFDMDLARLSPDEYEVLRLVARSAPISIAELNELADMAIVQSLVNNRLLVQVGERIDTYWDIFRDYVNTGVVPIQDAYILRLNPSSAMGKLLRGALERDGSMSVAEATELLNTKETVIFNTVRDLRLLGLVEYEQGMIRVPQEIVQGDIEEGLKGRAQRALKRHRALSVLEAVFEERGEPVDLQVFASRLPPAFPAVDVKPATWNQYARAFAYWFAYAGLIGMRGGDVTRNPEDTYADLSLLKREGRVSGRGTFPHCPAGPALEVARSLASSEGAEFEPNRSRDRKGLTALQTLGLVTTIGGKTSIDPQLFLEDGGINRDRLRTVLEERVGGAREAFVSLEREPKTLATDVGEILRKSQRAGWSTEMVRTAGKHFRSWARSAGVLPEERNKKAEWRSLSLFERGE